MNFSRLFDQAEHDKVVIECFSQLWEHSVDFMFIMAVEENGEFSLYDNNPASRRVMGLDPTQPIHRFNIRETWGDEVVEGLYSTYRKAILARKPISFDQFATMDDSPIYVNTLFVPIFDDDGNPLFVCGVSRDVSQIKEAEQIAVSANTKLKEYTLALENINDDLDNKVRIRTQELEKTTFDLKTALEAKSSFVSRMSHEVRTPINAMLGLTNLLQKTPIDELQQDYIDKILNAGHVLMNIVNDLLDFSKMEADKLQTEYIEFNPFTTIQQATFICEVKANEKNLKFGLDIDENLPSNLIGDPLRIQQIIINLLGNAVKFTKIGSVKLKASYRCIDGINHLLISVSDTGIGISKSQQQQLFTPFSQADSSITRQYGGTGLGLAICKKLCDLMGGTISIESELEQGTTFHVQIPTEESITDSADPLAWKQFDPEATSSISPTDNLANLSAYKLLLVDDNLINQQVACGLLKDSGIHIDTANDGESAIEKIKNTVYDIILMDLQMPKIDGLTAARYIRKNLSISVPIIALTAHTDESTIRECMKSGMNTHLSKPLDVNKLYRVLENYLTHQPETNKQDYNEAQETDEFTNQLTSIKALMSIDSLDIHSALESLNQSEELLLSLIPSFYHRYSNSVLMNQYNAALSLSLLTDEIHSLKSSAAYIGAKELSHQCATIEHQLRSGETSVYVTPIILKLKQLINHLQPLFMEHNSEKTDHLINQSLHSCIEIMRAQLYQSDFQVEHTLSKIQSLLSPDDGLAQDIASISDLVEELEFEKAFEISRKIESNLSGRTLNG